MQKDTNWGTQRPTEKSCRITPFYYHTTPVVCLPDYNLESYAGIKNDAQFPMRSGKQVKDDIDVFFSFNNGRELHLASKKVKLMKGQRVYTRIDNLFPGITPNYPYLIGVHKVPTIYSGTKEKMLQERSLTETELNWWGTETTQFHDFYYQGGGKGAVLYTIPPFVNDERIRKSGDILFFSPNGFISPTVTSLVLAINWSTNHAYKTTVSFMYEICDASGKTLTTEEVRIAPFGLAVVDIKKVLERRLGSRFESFLKGGKSVFCRGISVGGSLILTMMNIDHALKVVTIEHSTIPQHFCSTIPSNKPGTYIVKKNATEFFKKKFEKAQRKEKA
ncbi:hypothetical protein HY488_03010 [Candidatus Woesearchaeota archaeon]|nr:hypothetical protein [Candidatus Woesearchaeota archaeon]